MSELGNDLRDRLSDRSWVDRWAFLIFAFGGAAAIFAAKASDISAATVAGGAMLVMVAYAALVQLSGTGKLRSDQAGDNCYYLGLIYTLVSLAYAIFTFNPADTAATIVSGFGIALATTIMGLVLRVFFNQTRVDLNETEDSARLELAEAAGRLKAELAAITVSMNDFGRQTRQSVEELRDNTITSIVDAQRSAIASIQDTMNKASGAIDKQVRESAELAQTFSASISRTVKSIQRHATAVDAAQSATANLTSSLTKVAEAAQVIAGSSRELADRAEQLQTTQASILDANARFDAAARTLVEGASTLEGLIRRTDDLIAERLKEARAVPRDIAEEASRQLQATINDFGSRAKDLLAAQKRLVEEMSSAVEASLDVMKRHNSALEAELSQSSANVAKVHGALVEMTDKLADRIDR